MIGPVKAALESSVRYLTAELDVKGSRVLALSPGPLKTRVASGITHFDALLERARESASECVPERMLAAIEGNLAAFLASDGARSLTRVHRRRRSPHGLIHVVSTSLLHGDHGASLSIIH
jgi:enoyl-[acyl-carrier protein] reductase I